MDIVGILILAVFLGMPILGAVFARRKGRSAVGWFFIVFFLPLIGLLLLAVLPRLNLTCPFCAKPYPLDSTECPHCGSRLPQPYAASLLTSSGETYVHRCPQCGLPYRLEDYRPDAEHIYCSGCHAELPRHSTFAAHEADPDNA